MESRAKKQNANFMADKEGFESESKNLAELSGAGTGLKSGGIRLLKNIAPTWRVAFMGGHA